MSAKGQRGDFGCVWWASSGTASSLVLSSSTCLESVPNVYSVESIILPNSLMGQKVSHQEQCDRRLPIKESSPSACLCLQRAVIRTLIWEPQQPALVGSKFIKKILLDFSLHQRLNLFYIIYLKKQTIMLFKSSCSVTHCQQHLTQREIKDTCISPGNLH